MVSRGWGERGWEAVENLISESSLAVMSILVSIWQNEGNQNKHTTEQEKTNETAAGNHIDGNHEPTHLHCIGTGGTPPGVRC